MGVGIPDILDAKGEVHPGEEEDVSEIANRNRNRRAENYSLLIS